MRATTITTKKKARMKKKTTKTRIAGRANQSVRPALPQRAEKRNVARRSGARYVRAGRLSTTQTDTPINTHAYTPSTHANSRHSPRRTRWRGFSDYDSAKTKDGFYREGVDRSRAGERWATGRLMPTLGVLSITVRVHIMIAGGL